MVEAEIEKGTHTKGGRVMKHDLKRLLALIMHLLATPIILGVLVMSGWLIDHFLLTRFPLEGLSLISLRAIEAALHASALWLVVKLFLPPPPPPPPRGRWWI
jgi:hypothetical protein